MSVVLMAVVYVRAKYFASCSKAVLPGKPGVRETLLAGAGAMPALGIIIVIFGGILSGIGTPTEVSSVAVVYGFALCALYRRLTLRTFWTLTSDAAILSGIVLFIVANAQAFSWFLTVAGIPQDLLGLMARLPVWVFILVTIASMIVFGSILEGLPALLIFAPVLVPIAAGFGLAPLNYGIVLLAAMGIGAFLPPIGVGYYVACLVCKVPPESAVAKMLPYAAVVVASIIILAFVPWFSLAIPQAFHMAGAG
jgi:tripartite ATP-independent transporter DctM subunit